MMKNKSFKINSNRNFIIKHVIFMLVINFSPYLFAQGEWISSTNSSIKRIIINAYQKEFGYDLNYIDISSISFDEIERMCHELVNSETCSKIPEEKLIKCNNLEEVSDLQVTTYKAAGFGNVIRDMHETGGNVLGWIWNTNEDEKLSQADEVIGHIGSTINREISERYEPAKRIISPHNFLLRGVAWTGTVIPEFMDKS